MQLFHVVLTILEWSISVFTILQARLDKAKYFGGSFWFIRVKYFTASSIVDGAFAPHF